PDQRSWWEQYFWRGRRPSGPMPPALTANSLPISRCGGRDTGCPREDSGITTRAHRFRKGASDGDAGALRSDPRHQCRREHRHLLHRCPALRAPESPPVGIRIVMPPILLLHSFRHLGLMFLTRGAVYPGLPPQFAYPAALGDLLAAVLALVALWAVVHERRAARALVWIFNVEGTLDLITAIVLANLFGAPVYMGPAYWIPAFWVPALLVAHYITFIVLLERV